MIGGFANETPRLGWRDVGFHERPKAVVLVGEIGAGDFEQAGEGDDARPPVGVVIRGDAGGGGHAGSADQMT